MPRLKISLMLGLVLALTLITGVSLALGGGPGQPAALAARAAHPASGGAGPTSAPGAPRPTARAAAPGRYRTVPAWWRHGGRARYATVVADLWKVIMTDVVSDKDVRFTGDLRHLITDSGSALRDPPPVAAAQYAAAVGDLHQAGETGLRGSYARAYVLVRAGLAKLRAFNAAAGLKG